MLARRLRAVKCFAKLATSLQETWAVVGGCNRGRPILLRRNIDVRGASRLG
jgi:hypothetical protein